MLDYLINYGVKRHNVEYMDVDVNDRLALQDQINRVRKEYNQLLFLLDDIEGKLLDCNRRLRERTKEIIDNCVNKGEKATTATYSSDDIYTAIETERDALKTGASMVSNHIDYCKNDLRILNSVFYNKF